jgi:hypothetical protein
MAVVRHDRTQLTYDITAWILTGVSLVLILSWHLLPALLAGLLVYELVHILAPRLKVVCIHQEHGKLVAVALLATVVVLGIVLAMIGIMAFLHSVVILPMFGAHLPFTKTIIVVTFFVGLLPVVGNLVSNTIIVVVSLSVSLSVAIASLVFLVIIHKLEYFLNAHIVGVQIHARAWELLLAMLVMEAAFGIAGVIAAPIYYAYLKDELVSRGLI